MSHVELFPTIIASQASMDRRKPGSAAMGVFDGSRHSLVSPVSANVEVPLINKRSGQVISISGQALQIMDLESFEVFETSAVEEEIRDKIRQGGEVEYWQVLDRVKIVRAKG